jgi:hypothetical protein
VDVLAERLQELSITQGFGCISGPGIISGHPCPMIEQHVRCRFEVGGVEVFFPFAQPLEPQKAVMKSVLEALSLGNWAAEFCNFVTACYFPSLNSWRNCRLQKSGLGLTQGWR